MSLINPTAVGYAIINAIRGLSITPPADADSSLDTTYGPVFTGEPAQPAADASGFSGTYKTTNWLKRIGWGAGRYGPQQIVWRYSDPFTEAHRYGNGVAITQRHVITSQHGNSPENAYYFWLADGNSGRYVLAAYPAENVTYKTRVGESLDFSLRQIFGDRGWMQGYKLMWMTSDIPAQFIARIPHPSTWPDITGRPVILFNQFEEAVIWNCATDLRYPAPDPIYGGSHEKSQFNKPTDAQQAKLWRAVRDQDSGSPVFTTLTSFSGQVSMTYLGHVTNPWASPPGDANQRVYGPLSFANASNHDKLITAIKQMNTANGFSATRYMPAYVYR